MKLRAGRSTLRAPTRADAASIARHANNRKIWLNVRDAFPHPYTIEDAHEWIAATAGQNPRSSFSIDVNGEVCGGISLRIGHDVERISAELGYWLGEEYWGRGITTEAIRTITEYGFNKLGLKRIFAVPMAHNAASARVLEKNGYEREAIMRNACIKDGKIYDMLLYARIAPS